MRRFSVVSILLFAVCGCCQHERPCPTQEPEVASKKVEEKKIDNSLTARFSEVNAVSLIIQLCPRCGERHNDVKFRRFELNDIGGYPFWSTCPENDEPILLKVETD